MEILKIIFVLAIALVLGIFVLTPHGHPGVQPPTPVPTPAPSPPSDLLTQGSASTPSGWCRVDGQATGKLDIGGTVRLDLYIYPSADPAVNIYVIYGKVVQSKIGFWADPELLNIGPVGNHTPLPNNGPIIFWTPMIPLHYWVPFTTRPGFVPPVDLNIEVACAQPGAGGDQIERAELKMTIGKVQNGP